MLNEVMKFQSMFAIEDDGFIRVYQDSIANYIVIADIDGLKQLELKDLLKNIDMIFNLIDLESCNSEVYFEENGNFKELINKAIATLITKNEYERSIEYIKAIKDSCTYRIEVKTEEHQESVYCVGCGANGLFAFDEKDIDNVIANECNYVKPSIIAKFKTFEAAVNYAREHFEEYDHEDNF